MIMGFDEVGVVLFGSPGRKDLKGWA